MKICKAGVSLVDTFSKAKTKTLQKSVDLFGSFPCNENVCSKVHCTLTDFVQRKQLCDVEKVSTNERPALLEREARFLPWTCKMSRVCLRANV